MKNNSVTTLKDGFVRDIEAMILSESLRAGEKLPTKRELEQSIGVSMSVINSGIDELKKKGFVETRSRHGIYAADYARKGSADTLVDIMSFDAFDLGPEEVVSLIQLRMAIEKQVVRAAQEHCSEEKLKSLMSYPDTLRRQTDRMTIAETTEDFFQELAFLSGNKIFPLLYRAFHSLSVGLFVRFIEKNGYGDTVRLPGRLLTMLLVGDKKGAESCVENYLNRVIRGRTAII